MFYQRDRTRLALKNTFGHWGGVKGVVGLVLLVFALAVYKYLLTDEFTSVQWSWSELVASVLAILTTIVLVFVFYFTWSVPRELDAERLIEIQQVNAVLERERAQRAADQQKRLEQRGVVWAISERQREQILPVLSNYSGYVAHVTLGSFERRFAQSLEDILKRAGWILKQGISHGGLFRPAEFEGIVLSGPESVVGEIERAFRGAGIVIANTNVREDSHTRKVWFSIGHEPL